MAIVYNAQIHNENLRMNSLIMRVIFYEWD